MKKISFSFGIIALAAGVMLAKSTDDPVLMTINGRPVYKSEFEYLYNKNAGQQIEQQTLDGYVDMFVNYKLKVADALANKYDTTATFQQELSQYRSELSAPYMKDRAAEQELLEEAYKRYGRMLDVSHIMLPATAPNDTVNLNRADSIRTEILAGRLDWNDAAARFSIDRGTKDSGGHMGWMLTGRYPMAFEDAAYSIKIGEISKPVNSGFGYHLVRVDNERPNPGEVKARHILKLTARKSPEEAARAKEQIDSIYNVLMGGADFADVARRESEDPGSKANGGELDWFSSGVMVAPFDSAAFSMEEGVISKPVSTAYGWHILEVTGRRPMKSFDDALPQLKGIIENSEKGLIPEQKYLEQMSAKYNSHLLENNLEKIEKLVAANAGGYDSTMIASLKTMALPVAVVNGKEIPVSAAMKRVAVTASTDATNARRLITSAAKSEMDRATREQARIDLMDTNPDYRNLVNEYTDGILLFDISQDKVWQRASNDREGLEAYFKSHRDNYKFDEPRYKAYIIFTNSDSLETEIKAYLTTLGDRAVNPQEFNKELREKFGKHVRAERVIAKKGENAITDYLAFGGPMPDKKKLSWSNFFPFRGVIIEQPVEADDVRSKVTTDYQNELEKQWIKQIKAKYPVKIDKKVLKTVKEIPAKQ